MTLRFGRGVSIVDVMCMQARAAGLPALAWLEMTLDEWTRALACARESAQRKLQS